MEAGFHELASERWRFGGDEIEWAMRSLVGSAGVFRSAQDDKITVFFYRSVKKYFTSTSSASAMLKTVVMLGIFSPLSMRDR